MKSCPLCGHAHEAWQAHVFATNRVPVATNRPEPATNAAEIATNTDRTLNRRSRDAYNEYQREYMRKRRARG